MYKSELLHMIAENVSSICDVKYDDILNGVRTQDVVDARCLTIYWCKYYGLTTSDLIKLLHKRNANSIHSIIAHYNERYEQSFFFRHLDEDVRKKLRSIINMSTGN